MVTVVKTMAHNTADARANGADTLVQNHLRKMLARLSALKDQQRARERSRHTVSLNSTVEVDRAEDRPRRIGDIESPS